MRVPFAKTDISQGLLLPNTKMIHQIEAYSFSILNGISYISISAGCKEILI